MKKSLPFPVLLLLLLCAGTPPAIGQTLAPFTFPSSEAAASAWIPRDGAPAPQPLPGGGLRFPAPFNENRDRVYWDHDLSLDLSAATSIHLDLSCDQPDALRSLAIYFRSGSGWYIWNQPLPAAGRQRLTLRKADFQTEGAPRGWNHIDRIRISPWRGRPTPTALDIHSIQAGRDRVAILQATTSLPNDSERGLARRTALRISQWLDQSGIGHSLLTDADLDHVFHPANTIVILPYNPQLSAPAMTRLRAFTARGGKLLVMYSSSDTLAQHMGIRLSPVETTRDIARWRAFDFLEPHRYRVPPAVHQLSWAIGPARPAAPDASVIAYWANAAGQRSTDPAVLRSPHGFWFTHILQKDDDIGKRRMLTGLLASLDPTLWQAAAAHHINHVGKIDGYRSLDDAITQITAQARNHPDRTTILAFLERARQLHRTMLSHASRNDFPAAVETSYRLRDTLVAAYSLVQVARPGEIRGVWEHDGTGLYPGDWDRTCKLLADHGINTLFVNALWTGLAHYPSKHVPPSFTFRHYGDQLQQAITAARRHNISVHLWVVCWMVENAPADFIAARKKEGRLQQNAAGATRNWLNPAHPANRAYMLDILREAITTYTLDGLHLDYIRYPDSNACFSPTSRQAFQRDTKITPRNWPADVTGNGPHVQAFQTWRATQITSFVKDVRTMTRATKPNLILSVAVWGGYPQVAKSIGQDWATWLRDDLVDWVIPMNYSQTLYGFTALLDQQLPLPRARQRILPGIGVTANESLLSADQVIEQILATRQRGLPGFVLFSLSKTLETETLPALNRGLTRP
ncbi:MAG TPA: family 10 glycosylhydrolase [Kiritimatiellia bacterium]|nr:family 10 glycosylhydrolase [Kiritimatiellia bacterium]